MTHREKTTHNSHNSNLGNMGFLSSPFLRVRNTFASAAYHNSATSPLGKLLKILHYDVIGFAKKVHRPLVEFFAYFCDGTLVEIVWTIELRRKHIKFVRFGQEPFCGVNFGARKDVYNDLLRA